MTEVLHSPSHFPSSPSSLSCAPNDNVHSVHTQTLPHSQTALINPNSSPVEADGDDSSQKEEEERKKEEDQLSLLALLVTVFRKSLLACRKEREDLCSMEIGWPTDVRHVAHVTFDRFHGFLGLPVEFEPEVPRRAPSASANVFGVSTESMQCSYDSRGNSVPTILLLMQRRLYSQGGLRAEGIFRINGENSQEEYVRDQLNRGVVPDGIDVHCLAGLIKAWFRELPSGVLDSLTPEQVMQCQSEEDCSQLVSLLPVTEAALLDWAINLMADVVLEEQYNKMNARNIAMVFAPNMTQMADPLTALMYAVQVMNFLKTLIIKTLRERQDSVLEAASDFHSGSFDENGHHSPSPPCLEAFAAEEMDSCHEAEEPFLDHQSHLNDENPMIDDSIDSLQTSNDIAMPRCNGFSADGCSSEVATDAYILTNGTGTVVNDLNLNLHLNACRTKTAYPCMNVSKGQRSTNVQSVIRVTTMVEKSKGNSIVSRINSRVERVEAWR